MRSPSLLSGAAAATRSSIELSQQSARYAGARLRAPRGRGAAQAQVMRRVMTNPGLKRLTASWAAWVTADCAALVLLSVVAYTEGGLAAVGLAAAARVLPAAVATPWVAVATDRYPRVRVLAVAHAVCALQFAVLGIAAALHLSLLLVYGVVVLGAMVSAVVRPATGALAPELVAGPEELTGANAVYSTAEAAGSLLGPALAGVLLVMVGTPFAYVAIAVLSMAGMVVTLGIRTARREPAAANIGWRPGDFVAGFRSLIGDSLVRGVVTLFVAQTFVRGLLNVFVVAAAVSLLGLGESGASGLFVVIGVGGLLGSCLSFGMVARRRLALPFACGVAAWGLALLAIAAWPASGVAWIVLAGLGLGNAIEDVAGVTLLQRVIAGHHLGRALGALSGAANASTAVGSLVAPTLIALLGLQAAMGLSGAVLIMLVFVLWSRMRGADEALTARRHPGELHHQPRALVRVPPLSFDRVSQILQPRPVPAAGYPRVLKS
jgi:MFS family permease